MARKYEIPKTFEIDSDIVDRLATQSLKQHYNYTIEDMDDFVKIRTAVYSTLLNLLGHAYADQTRRRHSKIRAGYEG